MASVRLKHPIVRSVFEIRNPVFHNVITAFVFWDVRVCLCLHVSSLISGKLDLTLPAVWCLRQKLFVFTFWCKYKMGLEL